MAVRHFFERQPIDDQGAVGHEPRDQIMHRCRIIGRAHLARQKHRAIFGCDRHAPAVDRTIGRAFKPVGVKHHPDRGA